MKTWDVWQQRQPIKTDWLGPTLSGKGETFFEVNIVHVGSVQADSGSEAIDVARAMLRCFNVSKRTLAAFPLVSAAKQ